jgi:hypothetical protein
MEARSTLQQPSTLGHRSGADPLPEVWRLIAWRPTQLAQAGYADRSAAVLAEHCDVDLHRAINLLLRGPPEETALRILL